MNRHLSIGKKLLLLIALAASSLLIVGGVALDQMGKMDKSLNQTNQRIIPAIHAVHQLQSDFTSVRITLLYHILLTDPASMAANEQQLATLRRSLTNQLAAYQPLVSDAQEQRYLDHSAALLKEYFFMAEQIIALSQRNMDDAATGLAQENKPMIDQLVTTLGEHVRYKETQAQQHGAASQADHRFGLRLLWSQIVLAVLSTVVLGVLVHRGVTSSLRQMLTLFNTVEQQLDFTLRLPVSGRDEVGQTSQALNALLDKLQASFRHIHTQAADLAGNASTMAQIAGRLSKASQTQSQAARQITDTVQQLGASASQVADSAEQARQLSATALQQARHSESMMEHTAKTIHSLAATVNTSSAQVRQLDERSASIDSVLTVIGDVAAQTNLLALNAAIEAARAGEQGRGFAVVADEVRKLAERTALSTDEIGQTLSAMRSSASQTVSVIDSAVDQVDSSVAGARQANQAMHHIGSSAEQIAGMVDNIAQAVSTQKTANHAISRDIAQIADMSQHNTELAASTEATAAQLVQLADDMAAVVGQYRV